MINWILQKNLTKAEILTRIKSALRAKDEIWEEVEIIPFSNKIPEIKHKNSFKIIYGSTTFMLNAFNSKILNQGVFYNPEKFQMQNYVAKWKENVLNFEGKLIKFGTLEKIESEAKKRWFIRPNHDGKEFSGRVDTFENLIEWSRSICKLNLPDFNKETEVWVSEPKTIIKEWRLFIVNDEIVSASRYMHNGNLEESNVDIPKTMINFAEERIKEYRLDDIYVMDIAQVGIEYKLIECNCFNGTGFYKHDIEKVVKSVNAWIRNNKIKN